MTRPRALLSLVLAIAIAALIWAFFPGRGHGDTPIDDLGKISDVQGDGALGGDAGPDVAAPELVRRESGAPKDAAPAESEEYRRALSGLTGRLIWKGSREPIAGVEVRGIEARFDVVAPTMDMAMGLAATDDPVVFKGKSRTDADGRFRLEGLHWRSFLLLAIGLRTDKATIRVVDRMPSSGEVSDLGDIEILERGSVSGTLVDESGKPVAGARVRVADIPRMLLQFGVSQFDPEGLVVVKAGPASLTLVLPMPRWVKKYDRELPFGEARSDATGKFVVRGVRPGQSSVLVHSAGKLTFTKSLRVRALAEASVGTIRLKEGGILTGRVLDENGAAVTTARVSVGAMLSVAPLGFFPKPTVVSGDGRFRCTGLPRARLFVAYQREPGQSWELLGPHRAGDHVDIKLPALTAGEIAVVNALGEPVPDALVRLGAADEPAANVPGLERFVGAKHVTKASEAGTWKVRGVAAKPYRVLVKAKGFALGIGLLDLRTEVVKKNHASSKITIRLVPAPITQFEVVATANKPVAGARIYWWHRKGRGPKARGKPTRRERGTPRARFGELPLLLGRTDAHGRLQIDFIEAGATQFFARHPAYALASSGKQKTAPGATIRFVLKQGGNVAGVVLESGVPPKETSVIMASPRWKTARGAAPAMLPRLTWTDQDGKFRIAHLDPGNWAFQPVAKFSAIDSFASATKILRNSESAWNSRVTAEIRPGATTMVTIDKNRKSGGSGSIVGSIRVDGRPGVGLVVQAYAGRRRRVSVDASGNFRIQGVPDGQFSVRVLRIGDGGVLEHTMWSGQAKVKDGGEARLDVDLHLGALTIVLSDPAGAALGGLPVVLRSDGKTGSKRFTAVTEEDGRARFPSIPEATYGVQAAGEGDDSWVLPQTTIQVHAGGQGKVVRLHVVRAIQLAGAIRLDYGGLSDAERAVAEKAVPRWLQFRGGGRGSWGSIRNDHGHRSYRIRRVAPGKYTVSCWGGVQWSTRAKVAVHGSGLVKLDLVLVPNQKALRARLAAKAKAKKGGKAK